MMYSFSNYSWCEKIIILLISIITCIFLIDYKFALLPIHGIYLVAYVFVVTLCAVWVTFYYLRNVLLYNKPYEYDFERNKFLKLLARVYAHRSAVTNPAPVENGREAQRRMKSIDERIDILVKDIQVRFILKWYLHISTDPYFLSESKILIDDIIRRFLQVVIDVDARKLVYGCSIILLKHLKEFRKAIKRSQKNGGSVEDAYRYSNIASKSKKATDYFIYQLTSNVFRQFINWELWNSLPCQMLVSILAKKFTTYLLTFISTPGYLNYKILEACACNEDQARLNLNKYFYISLSDVDHTGNLDQVKDENNTPTVSPKRVVQPEVVFADVDQIDSKVMQLEVDSGNVANETEVVVEKSDRYKVSEPVKIYESKSSSNKTWRNSSDLECISLGQDLLTFQEFNDPEVQIQQLIERKLWKDNADVVEEEKGSSVWDVTESWYEEAETTSEATTNNFQSYLKSTANNALKPIGDVTSSTLHNMKELQLSTVHNVSQATSNAMHKIGDLQDEAAGVVEGIFDFGMAGLRKGLRFTGLQENLSELTQKAKNEFHDLHKTIDMQLPLTTGKITEAIKIIDHDLNKHKAPAKLVKVPRIPSEEKLEPMPSSSESDESVWMNPLTTKESPSFEGDILLERTPDAPKSLNEVIARSENEIPQITEEMVITGSPEPEYEDNQDFASTIAKLRSLLQQKSSESGFTTPSLSPMPQDEVVKTPMEPDAVKTNGAMPSLYKFCTRTATGVFQNTLNTIKTALPGNTNEASQLPSCNSDWTFVEADSVNDDFNLRVKKLLSERQAYCTVDTAYEAIHSLEIVDQVDNVPSPPIQFEDELDEFDLHIPITKVLLDIVCELVADTEICLLQETVVKALLLLIGNYTEEYITKQSDSLLHNINKIVGKLPENINQEVLPMKLDEMVHVCLKKFPGVSKNVLEAGVKLFISSLQSPKINHDIFLQVFELFASQLINACSQSSPAYSA